MSWATFTQFRMTRVPSSNSQVIRSVNKLFFFGLGRPHPTTVLSSLLFRVRTLLSSYIQPLSCSHGTYSHPITIFLPRSYFRPSTSPRIPKSHQIRDFFIPCYVPNCPRLLDGNYLSRVRIVNRWALTFPYRSKPLIHVANQMTAFKTLWTRL